MGWNFSSQETIETWDTVTVKPEVSKIKVFIRGTPKGLKLFTPIGGHWQPSSIFGDKLLWKKAQKKEKKNITSEIINRTIPHRKPKTTASVWRPKYVPSRQTSRHHWNRTKHILNILKKKIV